MAHELIRHDWLYPAGQFGETFHLRETRQTIRTSHGALGSKGLLVLLHSLIDEPSPELQFILTKCQHDRGSPISVSSPPR